jgi:hypothetical protein
MADEIKVTGEGGPEAAQPKPQPDNVVTDNSGQIPVQPVGTSDPTLDDNTNPKIPFDGGDPRNIPPHDSNEQLHISAAKRMGAETSNMTDEGERRRAVEAAYDNSKDVREVLDGADAPGEAGSDRADEGESDTAARRRAAAQGGSRVQPPVSRSNVDPKKTRA